MGQKYRPNYWKNAALLTGSDVVLRLAGLGLRIGLANALGGEGMGLYQLVLAVYGLFVTLATAGISVAATRLLTEELSRDAASARGMLRRLLALGAGLGVLASALHTAENMLVPACLAVYLTGAGGRAAALERYGVLKGMALPLLTFPFGLLGSLAVLLMPEITQAHVLGQTARLTALLDRMLRLTGFFSALAAALFWCWGPDAAGLLYGSAEAGFYLQVLAPVLPLLYLESMVDGAMKGVGEQKAAFRYSVWDAVLRLAGVAVLLPRYGMRGFLAVMLLSTLYTCAANTGRLLFSSGMPHAFRRWLGAPALAGALAAATGTGLRQALALPLAGDLWPRLAALGAGGCATAGVFLLAAWPLGLGEELKRVRGTI